MSARDELADLLADSIHRYTGVTTSSSKSMADELLAEGYRKPRTVTTRDEVLALHEGAVLLDSAGDVAQLRGGLWCGYEASPMSPSRQAKYIPATVLHEGEDRS
jgi:hypothetical protein